ncbi:Alkyl hydroperoxide reductase subunit C-like protein [Fimbriiglobus ruber]|uniref:thioredoxin-dependent peroxiredoxin n=2 Tax=Fimbriiglobus ruber TaxID=1908690 RepID=A0A225E779_9BACT|nr:Alkyl hydroperoxide reductase subunit C-like protein [Fimbriiglobus ruber]
MQPQLPKSTRPSRGGRLKWVPACVVVSLVLPATGFGLAEWVQDRPSARAGEETAPVPVFPRPDVSDRPPVRSLQEILSRPDLIPTHDHPLLGRAAPDFDLIDSEGTAWNLKGLRADGPVVVVFYHSYCDLCVRQLFDEARDLPLFREVGARVVAISADPPEMTRRRVQESDPFGFPILSDPENKVARAYQVFRRAQDGNPGDRLLHGTFIVDRDGTIRWVNVGDAPFRRDPALLSQLARIQRLRSGP